MLAYLQLSGLVGAMSRWTDTTGLDRGLLLHVHVFRGLGILLPR